MHTPTCSPVCTYMALLHAPTCPLPIPTCFLPWMHLYPSTHPPTFTLSVGTHPLPCPLHALNMPLLHLHTDTCPSARTHSSCCYPTCTIIPHAPTHPPSSCTHPPAPLHVPTCSPGPLNAPTHSLAPMHAPTCPPVCTYLHPSGTNLPPCPPACTHSIPVHAQMVPLHAPPTGSCTHLHPCSLHVPMGPSACTHPPSLPPAHTLGPLFQFPLDKPGCVFSSWVIVPETLVHYLPGVIITEMNYILVSLPLFSLPLDSVIIEWPYPVCLGPLELVLSYPMPWL